MMDEITYPREDADEVAEKRHRDLGVRLAHSANNVGEAIMATKMVDKFRKIIGIVGGALQEN